MKERINMKVASKRKITRNVEFTSGEKADLKKYVQQINLLEMLRN